MDWIGPPNKQIFCIQWSYVSTPPAWLHQTLSAAIFCSKSLGLPISGVILSQTVREGLRVIEGHRDPLEIFKRNPFELSKLLAFLSSPTPTQFFIMPARERRPIRGCYHSPPDLSSLAVRSSKQLLQCFQFSHLFILRIKNCVCISGLHSYWTGITTRENDSCWCPGARALQSWGSLQKHTEVTRSEIPNDNRDNNTNKTLEFVFSFLIYTRFSISPYTQPTPCFFIRQLVFTIHSEIEAFL